MLRVPSTGGASLIFLMCDYDCLPKVILSKHRKQSDLFLSLHKKNHCRLMLTNVCMSVYAYKDDACIQPCCIHLYMVTHYIILIGTHTYQSLVLSAYKLGILFTTFRTHTGSKLLTCLCLYDCNLPYTPLYACVHLDNIMLSTACILYYTVCSSSSIETTSCHCSDSLCTIIFCAE